MPLRCLAAPVVISLSLAAAACGGDDDGGSSADSAPTVELTGEQILDKLIEVDGDGSGLDCDTLDGVDGDELARAGRRTQNISTTPGDTLGQHAAFVRIPVDAVPGAPIDFYLTGGMADAPCAIVVEADFFTYPGEFDVEPDLIAGDIEGGNPIAMSLFTTIVSVPPAPFPARAT